MTYDTGHPANTPRRRSLWPLVLAVWTTAGLSPCALAAAAQLECLHCPAEDAAAGEHHAGHDQHGGHAPAEPAHDSSDHGGCDGDCDDDGESLVDARGGKSSSKDSAQTIAIAGPPVTLAWRHSPVVASGVDPPTAGPSPRIRLHRLYCVYRD